MLKIEYIPIEQLQTDAGNAKLHPAEQVEQIKKSITEFGMNDPIAVWKDNVIIEGHGRLIACRELGLKKVPVIRLDLLTDEERKAYGLIHNKTTMNSGFDIETLKQEIESISNYNMQEYGFEEILETYFDEQAQEQEQESVAEKLTTKFIIYTTEERLEELQQLLSDNNFDYKI